MHLFKIHNISNIDNYKKTYPGSKISSYDFINEKIIDYKHTHDISNKNECNYCKKTFDQQFVYFLYPDLKKAHLYCESCLSGHTGYLVTRFYQKVKRDKSYKIYNEKWRHENNYPFIYDQDEISIMTKPTNSLINKYISNLIQIVGFVPSFNYFDSTDFIYNALEKDFEKSVILVNRLCLTGRGYEKTHICGDNSWLKTLIDAKVIKNNAMKGGRGTRCIAEDEHECNSISEMNVDNWLYKNKIPHDKEPYYPKDELLNPNARLRADWKVQDYYLEFFGLEGEEEYDDKIEVKTKICEKNKIKLIGIYNRDLKYLDQKLLIFK